MVEHSDGDGYQADQADVPVAVADIPADTWNQELSHDPYTGLQLGYTTVFPADISQDLDYRYTETLMNNVDEIHNATAVLERHGPGFATQWLQPTGPRPPQYRAVLQGQRFVGRDADAPR